MQLAGRCSLAPAVGVHVAVLLQASAVFQASAVVPRVAFQLVSQPGSVGPAASPSSARPWPPLRCECLPLPAAGSHPPTTAVTNRLNRPTVTSYWSSQKLATVAGNAAVVYPDVTPS